MNKHPKKGDGVNPEETTEVGNTIQKKLDGKVPSITVERKSKVKSLGSDDTAPINALKYFNRLVHLHKGKIILNQILVFMNSRQSLCRYFRRTIN